MGGAEEQRTQAAWRRLRGDRGGYLGKAGHPLVWGFRVLMRVTCRDCGPLSFGDLTLVPVSSSWPSATCLAFPFFPIS